MRRTIPRRAAAAGLLTLAGAAPAWAEPGSTERVSVSTTGQQGNDNSFYPVMSAAARYVAFISKATNLVPGDTNHRADVFVRDRKLGTTELVSVTSRGVQSDGGSDYPSTSSDARYVAFASDATNLVKGDTNRRWDVFVRDRLKGTTERVGLTWDGAQIGQGSDPFSMISDDGRYVTFSSNGGVVKGGSKGPDNVFVRDRLKRTTERVSLSPSGTLGSEGISGQGRYVAFSSYAADHVKGDTNGNKDVFAYDRQTGKTVWVSVSTTGQQGNDDSYGGGFSPDGGYVVFTPAASNLAPNDTNNTNSLNS